MTRGREGRKEEKREGTYPLDALVDDRLLQELADGCVAHQGRDSRSGIIRGGGRGRGGLVAQQILELSKRAGGRERGKVSDHVAHTGKASISNPPALSLSPSLPPYLHPRRPTRQSVLASHGRKRQNVGYRNEDRPLLHLLCGR